MLVHGYRIFMKYLRIRILTLGIYVPCMSQKDKRGIFHDIDIEKFF